MLGADLELNLWSRNAQARVLKEFLIFNQVKKWLQLLKSFEPDAEKIFLRYKCIPESYLKSPIPM